MTEQDEKLFDECIAIARGTLARMSEENGWGADVEAIRAGKLDDDHRIWIAAQAILDYRFANKRVEANW